MLPALTGLNRVEARKVTKIYGRHRALFQVNLTLQPGRVTALLGPNGAGKTTLLWLFSTLSTPTSGTMHFGDLQPQKAKEARRHIGLLSHSALTYGDLTGVENVAFFGRLYGENDPGVATKLLEDFGLGDAMHRAAKTYSRGMMQRLGLCRALIGRPSLVLLDEPFTGLDKASTEVVIDRVRALRTSGAMVLMISHDLTHAAALADELVFLRRGRMVHCEQGPIEAEALRELYANQVEA